MATQRANRNRQSPFALPMVGLIVLAFVVVILLLKRQGNQPNNPSAPAAQQSVKSDAVRTQPATAPQSTMEVNKAVMVTAELDFGAPVPSIAQALTEIDRRYRPDDGVGRTFAILDAYGEPSAGGKLHISMHVSSEKPGAGALVFKRTGQVLWDSKITAVAGAAAAKNLSIYVADDHGASWIVDGTTKPSSLLDAKLRDKNILVRDFWPDGADRELTLIYSACGCPVKVMARRTGDHLTRPTDTPVIFPDDPPAVETIARLMGW